MPRNVIRGSHGLVDCTFGLQFGRILSDRIESKSESIYECAKGPDSFGALFAFVAFGGFVFSGVPRPAGATFRSLPPTR